MFRSTLIRSLILGCIRLVVASSSFQFASGADPQGSTPAAQPDSTSALPAPQAAQPGEPRLQAIPGLRDLIQSDGSILLPGGAGIIRRDPNQLGFQFNTPDGPFEIVIPRRRRASQNLGLPPAPGSDTDAPAFGNSSPAPGRTNNPDRAGRSGPSPANAENAQERRSLRDYAVTARLFHARNYLAALRRADRGLEREPDDPNLLQLRSLIFFTQGDYRPAYRDARAVLAQDEVWDWPTLRSLFHPGEYTAHYRALEELAAANPNAVELWFLLAYHNRMLGHLESSKQQFQRVAAIDPGNEIARRLSTGQPAPQRADIPPMPGTPIRRQSPARTTAPSRQQSSGSISADLGQPAPVSSESGPELSPPASSGKK